MTEHTDEQPNHHARNALVLWGALTAYLDRLPAEERSEAIGLHEGVGKRLWEIVMQCEPEHLQISGGRPGTPGLTGGGVVSEQSKGRDSGVDAEVTQRDDPPPASGPHAPASL
jgi:hypothetical protein